MKQDKEQDSSSRKIEMYTKKIKDTFHVMCQRIYQSQLADRC